MSQAEPQITLMSREQGETFAESDSGITWRFVVLAAIVLSPALCILVYRWV
jgi:hypothetical protein